MYAHTHPHTYTFALWNCQRVSGTDRLEVAQTGTHLQSLPSPLWCSAQRLLVGRSPQRAGTSRLWLQPTAHPLKTDLQVVGPPQSEEDGRWGSA